MRLLLAIVLTLLVPGTGQFINGQRWKGILFIGLSVVCIILEHTVSLLPTYLLYLIALVDVIIVGIQIIRGKRTVPTGKRYIIEVVVIFLIALTLFWGVDWGMELLRKSSFPDLAQIGQISKEEEQKIKEEAEVYLKDKYGKEFTVDNVNYVWQVPVYNMRGHLKGDPNSNFLVQKRKDEFSDAYFIHKMSDEGNEEIQPHVEAAFDPIMNWDSSVGIADQERERLETQDISYLELRKETNRYRQQIKVNVPIALTQRNKEEEMEKVYQLIEYLNQNEIMGNIEVFYYDPSIKEKTSEVDFKEQLDYGEYLTASLEVNDVSQITSVEDLNSFLDIY